MPSNSSPAEKNNKIYVANLPSRVREKDLESIFEAYGKISKIKIFDRREIYSIIEFDDYKDAEIACEKSNGVELHGRRLRVEMANFNKRFERNSSRERG